MKRNPFINCLKDKNDTERKNDFIYIVLENRKTLFRMALQVY
jgi:hypothetical protein